MCTVDNFEIAKLVTHLHKLAPTAGSINLSMDELPQGITIDVGLRRPARVSLSKTNLVIDGAVLPWKFLTKVAKKKRSGVWHCYPEEPPC